MRTAFTCLWLAMLFVISPAVSAQTSMSEYHVKALFLLNFVNYVDWPEEQATSATVPFVIGILGRDNIEDNLTAAIIGRRVNGRKIAIVHLSDGQDAAGCSILFISASEDPRLGDVLLAIKGLPILTVGETEPFLQKGGIINLVVIDNKIHLQINLGVARLAKLRISSKLLSVADVVQE